MAMAVEEAGIEQRRRGTVISRCRRNARQHAVQSHQAQILKITSYRVVNETKLEDESEYIITLMRQDSSVKSLREKLPQALEALDKIK
jgi:hypothetical protein